MHDLEDLALSHERRIVKNGVARHGQRPDGHGHGIAHDSDAARLTPLECPKLVGRRSYETWKHQIGTIEQILGRIGVDLETRQHLGQDP